MSEPIARLVSAAASARGDRFTIEVLGIESALLMERAALAVAHEVVARWPGRRVVALCGPGNNGGDGLAMARQLHGWGVKVEAWLVGERRGGASQAQIRMAEAVGVAVGVGLPEAIRDPEVVAVDALLGTGSAGAPRGAIAAGVSWLLGHVGPVVAIDLPTGVDADSGEIAGEAVRAALTVTMQASKPGLHITPGRERAGEVVIAAIGLREDPADGGGGAAILVDPALVRGWLEALRPGAHKGERGHVGVIAGSPETPGAAVLAATAALRCGAGLVTLGARDVAGAAAMIAHRPELMLQTWSEGQVIVGADVLVVGPGLTREQDRAGLTALWAEDPRPALWDASALLAIPLEMRPGGPRVLTPHPGEAAGLLRRLGHAGASSGSVQGARRRAVTRLSAAIEAVVVLKGEGTLIAEGERLAIAVSGGPGLATAGSGDCLSGFIAALMARGLSPWAAALAGVHVHGVAGELAVAAHPGALALDLTALAGAAMVAAAEHPRMPRRRLG